MSSPTEFPSTSSVPPSLPVRPSDAAPLSTDWIATPPPLPPPLPPTPIPFANEPMRVIPLAYAEPSLPTRPTGLVVIGVMSILIGLISAFATAGGLWFVASRYSASVPPPPPAPMAPLPPAHVTPHTGDFTRAGGLKQRDREIVMRGVAQRIALPPDRAILLERFLADIGRTAFGEPPLTEAVVARDISEAGQRSHGIDGAGVYGTHYLITSRGRLRLDNAVASFQPGDALGAGVGSETRMEGNALITGTGVRNWSAAALNEWIERIAIKRRGLTMTAQQAAVVLEQAAQSPTVVTRQRGGSNSDFTFLRIPERPLDLIGSDHIDVVRVFPARQPLYVLPDGRTADGTQAPAGLGPAPDYIPLPARPTMPFRPALQGSLNAIRAVLGVEVVALILALTLIIAGVRTLNGSPGAAGLHILWACVKLVFCFIALAVGIWWSSSMMTRYGSGVSSGWLGKSLITVVLSLVYPGVVLGVMNSFVVREYYRSIGEPMWLFSPQRRAAWGLETAEILVSPLGRAILWAIGGTAALAAVGHLFAAVYVLIDGLGHAAGRSGEHLFAILIAAGIAAAAYSVYKWARRTSRSVFTAFPGFHGGET